MLSIQELASSRPPADHSIEQFLMESEALSQQAEHVGPFLADKRVFFLGDDDHISPVLAYRFAVTPIVYEVDQRVRNNLRTWFSKLAISGSIVDYDARLPIKSSPQCEAFYINPPYSSKSEGLGIKVWLMRAFEACVPSASGVLVMPWDGGNMNQAWIDIVQESVTDFIGANGCIITKVEHNTASYSDTTHPNLMSSNVYIQRVDTSKQKSVNVGGLYN